MIPAAGVAGGSLAVLLMALVLEVVFLVAHSPLYNEIDLFLPQLCLDFFFVIIFIEFFIDLIIALCFIQLVNLFIFIHFFVWFCVYSIDS